MLEKARFVLDEMERRMSAFGGSWRQTTAVQLYTVQDIHSILENELGRRGVAARIDRYEFLPTAA